MKDILGREIEVGDIIGYAVRSGNSGDMRINIVVEVKGEEVFVMGINGLNWYSWEKDKGLVDMDLKLGKRA